VLISAKSSADSDQNRAKTQKPTNGQSAPSPISAVIPDIIPSPGAADTRAQLIDETVSEILELTHEPHWRDWWLAVCGALWDTGTGWTSLCDLVNHVRDCSCEATRRAKDLGTLDDAAGFLVKRTTVWMKAAGMKWPKFPARDMARESIDRRVG